MGRAGSSQIGVEGGSQPTDQEFGSVAHGDPIVLHGHGTIRDETEKARPVDDGSPRSRLCDLAILDKSTVMSHMSRSMMSARKRSSSVKA